MGATLRLPGTDAARPKLAVFVSPTCRICGFLQSAVPVVERNYPEIHVVTIITGGGDDKQTYAKNFGTSARLDLGRTYASWDIPGTPYAVGLDKEQRLVSKGVVNNLDQLEAVAESTLVAITSEGAGSAPAIKS